MGQSFKPVIEKNNKLQAYAREINGESAPFKLTDQSWIHNNWVNRISEEIYNQPARVAWLGEYACDYQTDEEYPGNISLDKILELDEFATQRQNLVYGLISTDFDISDKFLINHDKKLYIDMHKYIKKNTVKETWCLHPLPLLTCFGNGFGSSDYNHPTDDSTFEYVGSWGWDLIEITDEVPKGYSEFDVTFKETNSPFWEEPYASLAAERQEEEKEKEDSVRDYVDEHMKRKETGEKYSWSPMYGENYYYVNKLGEIRSSSFVDAPDIAMFAIGNCFEAPVVAAMYRQEIMAKMSEIRKDMNEAEVDV